jgi:hypothetical protein
MRKNDKIDEDMDGYQKRWEMSNIYLIKEEGMIGYLIC